MKIGIGASDITPPFPCPLAGFGAARTAAHEGLHDPISAQCVLFEAGDERLALLSCDVIGLKELVQRRIREALPDDLGLPAERLIITATHTHGAPVIDGDYVPFLVARVVDAIRAAHDDLRPRDVAAGIGRHEEWVGFNRRHLETGFLPVDKEIPFLAISEPEGALRAVVFNYACHPSILGPNNLLITADWPGFVRAALREKQGNDLAVIFLQGAEGNINTGYSAGVSALGVKIPTRTYAVAERSGRIVAGGLLRALENISPMPNPRIRFISREVAITYRSPEGLPEAVRQREARRRELTALEACGGPNPRILDSRVQLIYAEFLATALEENARLDHASITLRQVAFAIGDAGFLCLPGEFFVECGLRIKEESRSKVTFPLGMANGYLGYFPTKNAYSEGGYEAACARFAESTADDWTHNGIELLNGLLGQIS